MRLRHLAAAFISAALVAAALYVTPNANAIVGGSNAGPYTFMASLQLNGGHFCGAVIIRPIWLVTAAHCVAGKNAADFKVRYGSTLSGSGGILADVDRVISFPGFGGVDPKNRDIALVRMHVPTDQRTIPITIADQAGPVGTRTRILGWGATCGDCGGSSDLKELDTSILAREACGISRGGGLGGGGEEKVPIIGSMEICTDNPGGNSGACRGDSGGPQIKGSPGSWQLIGVTSRGSGGGNCVARPSVYTDVTQFSSWIFEQIDAPAGSPNPPGEAPPPSNGGPNPPGEVPPSSNASPSR